MSNKWNYDSFTISNAVYIFSFANLHNFEWNEKRGGKNSVEKNNNNFLLTTFCLLTTSSNNSYNIKLNKYKLQNVQNNCNAMCMIMLLLILPILLCSPFPSALTLPKHRSFSSFRYMQMCTNAAIHTAYNLWPAQQGYQRTFGFTFNPLHSTPLHSTLRTCVEGASYKRTVCTLCVFSIFIIMLHVVYSVESY